MKPIEFLRRIASGAEIVEGAWELGEYFAKITIHDDGHIIIEIIPWTK
jgi:hypothetical protein